MRQPFSIVIVNYRTPGEVADCLRSIFAQDVAPLRVFVVDNASGDDSLAAIGRAVRAHGWGDAVQLLAQPRNGGFAYGCNAGVRAAFERDPGCRLVLFANPDTQLRAGALRSVLAFMDRAADAGIVGCAVEDPGGEPQLSAHAFPGPLAELDDGARLGVLSRLLRTRRFARGPGREEPFACDWVSGACFAVRREVFETIGLLDEGFFLYFEEVDFCRRASRAGWKVYHLPQARVMHVEGASTGIRDANRRRPAYWFASRRRFFLKHHGAAGLLAADVLWSAGRISWKLRRLLGLGGRGTRNDPPGLIRDLLTSDLRAALGLRS